MAMSCVNPRMVFWARGFTGLVYHLGFEGFGSVLGEPSADTPGGLFFGFDLMRQIH